ncbi:MAG: NrfD/PsrC family molybdoenzyme membrane anchor subunit [Deltaproteobacteria bacterium]|nr:NrfD/PsrC family molybdoenzyme membrane anchor subunit [Candidatus Deferrimicrobiaceae bacterium]
MNPEVHVPGWEWYYVAMYFFIAGISAGAYFIATLAELFGGEKHREISRTGFYIAFPLILLTPPLLIADLGRPERFWHLLLYSKSGFPYLNFKSPLSVGSWALLLFGGMALLSFLDNLVAEGRLKRMPFGKAYNRIPRKWYAVVGSIAGFFVAGYTGVILNVTARPFWAATDPLVGALFIASAASTGAAAIYLVMVWRKRLADPGLPTFERFDRLSKVLELVLAVAVVLIAGRWAAPLVRGMNALMFWGGAVLLGTLVPLAAAWYLPRIAEGRADPERWAAIMSVFVLVGGALLRISLVQAGQVQ